MALPSPLQNFLVQQANGQIFLSWDFAPGDTSYLVEKSTDQITYTTLASPTAPSYLDEDVVVGTEYWYRVSGVNGSGTGSATLPQSAVPTHSGEMTLGQLRLLSKQKADLLNSQFITDAEWNVYINQSYFELYDLLVQKYGNEYFVEHVEFTLTGDSAYALPNGTNFDGAKPFYKLLGVELNIAGQDAWLTLKKYMFISRNQFVYPQINTNLLGVGGMKYRLLGSEIHFIPTPASGQQIRLWYIPRMYQLLQDTDIADGISGWTEYIAVDAAIKALNKQEDDTQALTVDKAYLISRIEAAAENRDAGEPETISDTRRYGGMWGWGWGNGGDGPIGGV